MSSSLYLVLDDKQYFYELISDEINMHSVYRGLNRIEKLFYKQRGRFYGLVSLFLGDWKSRITEYDCIIVFDSAYTRDLGKYIKRRNEQCKLILYFYNPILFDFQKRYISDNNVDEIWSFDHANVREYGLKYNSTFYTRKIDIIPEKEKSYDVVYVGRDKSRKSTIDKIEKLFMEEKINYWFHIPQNENEFINYRDYIGFVKKAKCILDITQEKQSGLTMRFMESLFLHKKIITNNVDIQKYDFYNPNNVFIIGLDDIGRIREFIYGPYVNIDDDIVDYYEADKWARRFLYEENNEEIE